MEKKRISLIVPCYNEQEALPLFYEAASRQMSALPGYDFELLFVDDGSRDRTLSLLKAYAEKDAHVRYLSFSRNFGKESAMYAGLVNASGDYVAFMDADLQDPPELLPQMLDAVEKEGFDSAAARRVNRKGEGRVRSFFSRSFYGFMSRLTRMEMVEGARDFRLMTREFVDALLALSERCRFTKGLFSWVGFKTKWIGYENVERAAGETKWSMSQLFKYAFEGIIAFSVAPLTWASVFGIAFCGIALLAFLFVFIRALVCGDPVAGWPSLVCIILFLSGVQLFCLGMVGQYLSRVYTETKRRPLYICRESNVEKEKFVKIG